MIVVASMSHRSNSLHDYEFVKPVENIVRSRGIRYSQKHYSEMKQDVLSSECTGVILCGSGLGDNFVLEDVDTFSYLQTCGKPVLGICVGANLLSLLHGGTVEDCLEIGMVSLKAEYDRVLGEMDGKEVYSLHTLAPLPPSSFDILANGPSCIHAFRIPRQKSYGILFHPEVRHPEIIERFCDFCLDVPKEES